MKKNVVGFTILTAILLFNAFYSMGRSQFVHYRLNGQNLSDDQFVAWIKSKPIYNGLIIIKLDNNHLTAKSVEILSDSNIGVPNMISLANNPIGDDGAKALGSPKFSGTTIFYLSNAKITDKGIGYLFGSSSSAGFLRELDLSKNNLGDSGVAIIANNSKAKNLTNIYLDHTGMTDLGARALANSPYLGSLEYLSVSGNRLTADGISSIENSSNFAQNAVFYFGENVPFNNEKDYIGYYTEGFEYRVFNECGSKERWWVSYSDTINRLKVNLQSAGIKFSEYSRGDNPQVLIKIRGVLSKKGNWGHMGRYSYELDVNHIVVHGEELQQECIEH